MTSTPTIDLSIFEGFLAERRAKHGDLRMEVTDETPPADTETETPPADTETPPADAEQETPPADEVDEAEATQVAELPEFARNLIAKLRGEAANNRVRATSTEEKLANAKTPEDIEAAVAAITAEKAALERQLLVTQVATQFELPTELAELLKGDDKAALESHAKTLQKYAGSSDPETLSGGLTPQTGGDTFDPVAEAQKHRRSRY